MKVPFMDLSGSFQYIREDIDNKISELIDNTNFVGGEEITLFEREYAEFCNTKYAVGCSNGTDALIIALKILGIGRGDKVLVPANTFIATAESVEAVGADVDFIDIENNYHTMDPDLLEEYLDSEAGDNVKAVIPVHLYGQMAEMDKIEDICRKYDIKIIEDSAQAHGSLFNNKAPGHFGDIATYSFYPGKNLGAFGDAGALTMNSEEYYTRAKMLINHGRYKEKYNHSLSGYNKRMDTIQAGILRIKLRYLSKWNDMRIKNAGKYRDFLSELDITLPEERNNSRHVYHLFVIESQHRNELRNHLKENGISTGIHYPIPLHLQNAFRHLDYSRGDYPVSEEKAEKILSLPMWPEISEEQIEYVSEIIARFINNE